MNHRDKPIRVLVADDEPVARRRVCRLLRRHADVSILGEARNGSECIRLIRTHWPDLVFLDVQMPKLDGFEVVDAIGVESMPLVVFVTAYEEHAIRAFDVSAIDYLLKPFNAERFDEAFRRARTRLENERGSERVRELTSLLERVGGGTTRPSAERVMVKTRGRIHFVNLEEVHWIEAAGNYVRLHIGTTNHLVRATLSQFESRLDPAEFPRIHRSAMVNLAFVKEMSHWSSGEYQVVLTDGTSLKLSRTYRERLLKDVLGAG